MGKKFETLKNPVKPLKDILENSFDNSSILQIFEKEKSLEEILQLLNNFEITSISKKFIEKVEIFDWNENDKREFLSEMLSFSPKERMEIIDDMLEISLIESNN